MGREGDAQETAAQKRLLIETLVTQPGFTYFKHGVRRITGSGLLFISDLFVQRFSFFFSPRRDYPSSIDNIESV